MSGVYSVDQCRLSRDQLIKKSAGQEVGWPAEKPSWGLNLLSLYLPTNASSSFWPTGPGVLGPGDDHHDHDQLHNQDWDHDHDRDQDQDNDEDHVLPRSHQRQLLLPPASAGCPGPWGVKLSFALSTYIPPNPPYVWAHTPNPPYVAFPQNHHLMVCMNLIIV